MDDTVAALPPRRGLGRYLATDLRGDVLAGLTVAVMGVPQAMAYAVILDLPPVYGLYVSIVTCAVAALFGSSKHLVTGPTNSVCMVLLSVTGPLVVEGGRWEAYSLLEMLLLLSLMAGTIQLSFGLLRMGGVVRYVSSSVVIGFTAGAGVLIALNQIPSLLDFEIQKAEKTQAFRAFWAVTRQLEDGNLYTLGVGLATALLVVFIPRIDKRLPGAFIAVVATGLACYFLRLGDRVPLVGDKQEITGGLDMFHLPELVRSPNLELTTDLISGAFAVAILGLIEATSISRSIARNSGQRLDFNREFIGQGTSKIVGGFLSCFAGSGSFTRTALCYRAGGRTRMAAVFSAVWTLATLVLLGPIANDIPRASLAGLLIVTAYMMIDRQRLAMSWRSGRNSQIVLAGTIAAGLVLPLQYAIFVGVFLSLVIILWTTGKTHLTQLVPRPDGGFDEVPFNRAAPSAVVTVNMEGDIYFAAAEDLDNRLLHCITPETRVVVLRMKRLRAVGSTAMAMLEQFWTLLHRRNISLVVSGIEKELEDVMTSTGVRARIGEANIFFADNKLFQATELAMARAKSIAEWRRKVEEPDRVEEAIEKPHVIAQEIMNTRCIRFGNKHQVREAMWLMSEMHKHIQSVSPEPLFLQDREGKLFGELSPWQILELLADGAADHDTEDLEDEQIAALLRRDFTKPIRLIARTDVVPSGPEASLSRLLESAVARDQHVTPICDDDRRIKGLVTTDDLIRGLGTALAVAPTESGANPEPEGDGGPDAPPGDEAGRSDV